LHIGYAAAAAASDGGKAFKSMDAALTGKGVSESTKAKRPAATFGEAFAEAHDKDLDESMAKFDAMERRAKG
jgi:hypothetical protein